MFESIHVGEMSEDDLDLTEAFGKDMRDWAAKEMKDSEEDDAAELADIVQAYQLLLMRIQNERERRKREAAATKIQAAARGFLVRNQIELQKVQAQNEAATKIQAAFRGHRTRQKFQELKQHANDHAALMGGNVGGPEMAIARDNMLNSLRTMLTKHLGVNAPLAFQVNNGNTRIKRILEKLEGWDKSVLEHDIHFKRLLRQMQTDISHRNASKKAVADPTKLLVTDADLSFPNYCTTKILSTNVFGGLTIPSGLTCKFNTFTVHVQGIGGAKPPMSKHLKEYLEYYGNDVNIYDAIAYCRSWIWDMGSITRQRMKTAASSSAHLYSNSNLRWEFLVKVPSMYDSVPADFLCYHVVAKGFDTGINPYAVKRGQS